MYVVPDRPRRCAYGTLTEQCPEPVEGHELALRKAQRACLRWLDRLSTHQRFDRLSAHTSSWFDNLSAHLFSQDRRHSIWIVGGKSDHPKIAAEPDVIRFVHSPGVHLVTPVQ